eukprot:10445999-Alexandrium_andersonii.AAC.1
MATRPSASTFGTFKGAMWRSTAWRSEAPGSGSPMPRTAPRACSQWRTAVGSLRRSARSPPF